MSYEALGPSGKVPMLGRYLCAHCRRVLLPEQNISYIRDYKFVLQVFFGFCRESCYKDFLSKFFRVEPYDKRLLGHGYPLHLLPNFKEVLIVKGRHTGTVGKDNADLN